MPHTFCYLDDGSDEDLIADEMDRKNFEFQVQEAQRLFEQQRQQDFLNAMLQQQMMEQAHQQQMQQQNMPPMSNPFGF